MSSRLLRFSVVLFACCVCVTSYACLWDTETLWQERGFAPSTLEVIVGKFPRHSDAYYEWRRKDRLKKLESEPQNDALIDDLAVAYEKLGRHGDAIAAARSQLARQPKRYETLANLGTFLIHDGQLEEGLGYIEQAIEVNPDAHFGREKYQRLLVKYLLLKSSDGKYELPLASSRIDEKSFWYNYLFVRFAAIELSDGEATSLDKAELLAALEGVTGMMRFSRHDHPVLLEVLGEILQALGHKRLAYRSYRKAALASEDESARNAYELFASRVIDGQYQRGNTDEPISVEMVNARFDSEQRDADEWFANVAKKEAEWIADDEDVDARFAEAFRLPPVSVDLDDDEIDRSPHHVMGNPAGVFVGKLIIAGMGIAGILGCVLLLVMHRKRSRRLPTGR
ncbi:tetratricopeptide repeat protein [Planctomycetes bacterium K23_9]|uniref:Tetratricopeptide repeat protein n=1 Tax=Stieleria marina TaxID=1930275 RepID=A0A517NQJ0_9BACT|nr:Tetratricopeptide repeat protein [Planctomycetes bacterium K23_9]